MNIFLSIFIFAALLNFIWEFLHCRLYETCKEMDKQKLSNLLVVMSLKDALFVILFYVISIAIYGTVNMLLNISQLVFFVLISLIFSYLDEMISLKLGRWKYTKKMPRLMGAGITPLLEIAVTGVIAIYITTLLF